MPKKNRRRPKPDPHDRETPLVRADFIAAMLNELAVGEAKYGPGSWRKLRYSLPSVAFSEISLHAHKLSLALDAGDKEKIREHCADLANIAMKTEESFGPDAP